ncbi:hypothetical protein PMAYCL1PPCAC_20957, partial [Pristionchus mayeri]
MIYISLIQNMSRSRSPMLEDDDDFYLDDIPDDTEDIKREEKMMTLENLPDDLLMKLIKLSGVSSRSTLKLVSKAMERRMLALRPIDSVKFEAWKGSYSITINSREQSVDSSQIPHLLLTLNKWSGYTRIVSCIIEINDQSEADSEVIAALLQF